MEISDKLTELLHRYFELGVAEGREGRNHDTEGGDAQRMLSEIEYEIAVHRLTKATTTDIKTIASQVAYVSLSSVNAHSSRAVEIASAHVERALVASALSVSEPAQTATDVYKPLQSENDIKPVAWVYAADLEKGDGCFGDAKGEVIMGRGGNWVNADTPLYAAPPAPSVAVKALEFYADRSYWEDSHFVRDTPNVIEIVMSTIDKDQGKTARVALSVLSAQVQDVKK